MNLTKVENLTIPDDFLIGFFSIFMNKKEKEKLFAYKKVKSRWNFVKDFFGDKAQGKTEALKKARIYLNKYTGMFNEASGIVGDTVQPILNLLPLEARITFAIIMGVVGFAPALIIGFMLMYYIEEYVKKTVYYHERTWKILPDFTKKNLEVVQWYEQKTKVRRAIYLSWSKVKQLQYTILETTYVSFTTENFPDGYYDKTEVGLAKIPYYVLSRKIVAVKKPMLYQPMHNIIFAFKSITQLINNSALTGILDFTKDLGKVPIETLIWLMGGDVSNNQILSKWIGSTKLPTIEEQNVNLEQYSEVEKDL